MIRHRFDQILAAVLLLVLGPAILLAALAVRIASPGPAFYRARRVGRGGRCFDMYKLRTMRVASASGPPITATDDPRVFPLGRWLRRFRIDELPQLVNVLRREMAFVGPRPEDPAIVRRHYTSRDYETLRVLPGLTSPGTLHQVVDGDAPLRDPDPVRAYVRFVLPGKLALDVAYARQASLATDLRLIARTVAVLLSRSRAARTPLDARVDGTTRRGESRERRSRTRSAAAALSLLLLALPLAGSCDNGPSEPGPIVTGPVAQLVGAGDIATCGSDDDSATAALLDTIPGIVFTLGDNAYPDGSSADYADCYAPTWGRHRARTRPAPGNHEYLTPGATPYYSYFGALAGPAGRGYYSFDAATWHVVVLNSVDAIGPGSDQLAWLRADLAGRPQPCVLAYWHHPRFSSGGTHGSLAGLQPLWEVLYDAGVDVVLNGHEHDYERFAPQTPAGAADAARGIRAFVVGTGGAGAHGFAAALPTSEVRETGTPGVLLLTLEPGAYTWRFIHARTGAVADAGSDACHDAPASAPPPGGR